FCADSSSTSLGLDERILGAIEAACRGLEYQHVRVSSGAGHDAGHLAPVAPVGMIFVPSQEGVSHNPAEHTELDDLVRGTDAGLSKLPLLDRPTGSRLRP